LQLSEVKKGVITLAQIPQLVILKLLDC
jgi:hypothetical protein